MRALDWQHGAVDRAHLLDGLVSSVLPTTCSNEVEQQAMHNRLFGYVMRLADSGIAANQAGDPDTVFHLIKQRLVQQQRQDDAARCEASVPAASWLSISPLA